jgi:hypothetical protein
MPRIPAKSRAHLRIRTLAIFPNRTSFGEMVASKYRQRFCELAPLSDVGQDPGDEND